jgi:uroporphyrinogen-III synthase
MATVQKRKPNGHTPAKVADTAKFDKQVRRREQAQATGKRTSETLEALGVVPEWNTYQDLRKLDFGELCEKRQRLADEIKFREEKKKELDEEITAALAVAGVEKCAWEGRNVQIVHKAGSRRIVAEKLLENGVPADVIADSTVEGNPSSYLLIGKPKE